MQVKDKKRVGVVRGGTGEHYHSSLKKGGDIISLISENLPHKYKIFDILIDKENVWHINGLPVMPADLINKIDVVWNTAHPNISVILDNFSIPNVGGSSFSHVLQNNKEMLREHVKKINVSMPRHVISPKSAREVFEKFSSPWIVKINNEIKLVKTFNELAEVIKSGDVTLVEEFISGKIASVHSIKNFRGEDFYTLPLGNSYGVFSAFEREKLYNLAKDLHKHIGVKHYLKLDFVMNSRGKIYLLNINSVPDLKPDSHFSEVCELVGAKMYHVVEHILERAI